MAKGRAPRYPRTSRCKRYRFTDEGPLGQFKATCLDCEKAGRDEHAAYFVKREPLTLVQERFLHDSATRDLPCKGRHVAPIVSYAVRKWLKCYWAVRTDLQWTMTKKVRGPVEALNNHFGEEAATNPVLALGLDPKTAKRPPIRFNERYEIVELGPNHRDAKAVWDDLKRQAAVEQGKRNTLATDVLANIANVIRATISNRLSARSKMETALKDNIPLTRVLAQSGHKIIGYDAVHEVCADAIQKIAHAPDNEEAKARVIVEAATQAAAAARAAAAQPSRLSIDRAGDVNWTMVWSTMLHPFKAEALTHFASDLETMLEDYESYLAIKAEMTMRAREKMKPIEAPPYQ